MEPSSMTRSIPRASARAGTRARLSLGLAPALLPGAPVPPVGEEASSVNVAADRPGSTQWPSRSTPTGRPAQQRHRAVAEDAGKRDHTDARRDRPTQALQDLGGGHRDFGTPQRRAEAGARAEPRPP